MRGHLTVTTDFPDLTIEVTPSGSAEVRCGTLVNIHNDGGTVLAEGPHYVKGYSKAVSTVTGGTAYGRGETVTYLNRGDGIFTGHSIVRASCGSAIMLAGFATAYVDESVDILSAGPYASVVR